MRHSSADQLRLDLALWSEPLISDIVNEAYGRCATIAGAGAIVARFHVLLWRHVIVDHPLADTARRELVRVVNRFKIDESVVREIDAEVVAELMHVISSRFQSSPMRTRDCSLEVTRAACWLVEARRAA